MFAPTHMKWLAAEGLDGAFSCFTSVEPHCGPTRVSGLTQSEIRARLGSNVRIEVRQQRSELAWPEFGFEDPEHPVAAQFRKDTADLVPEQFDVFEVSRRVRALAPHVRNAIIEDDVQVCLREARKGSGLWCHHFSRIFGSVCSVNGYASRLVSLSTVDWRFEHAMCEVYVPEFGKWVVIDTDFEHAYKRDGVWLNAVELCEAWRDVCSQLCPNGVSYAVRAKKVRANQHRITEITGVHCVRFGDSDPDNYERGMPFSPSGMNLELFEYVFIAMRDDYLSRDYLPGHPLRTRQFGFQFDGTDHVVGVCPEAIFVDADQIYAPLSLSWIDVTEIDPGKTANLRFSTYTPRFHSFRIRRDSGDWEQLAGNVLEGVALRTGISEVEVQAINSSGVSGETAVLRIVVSDE